MKIIIIFTHPVKYCIANIINSFNFYSLVQKVVLVYIANFALHDNSEGGWNFLLVIYLNYIKPYSSA